MSRKKTFKEFLEEAKKRHPDNDYEYVEETYINTHTPMTIICPKHGKFRTTPKSHLLYECRACSYEKRAKNYMLTTEKFIEKAVNKHGKDKYDYSKVDYKGTHIPVTIICSIHGEFSQKPNDHLCGKGCPKCNESLLERQTDLFLKENNINYISQYKTSWLGKQSLDFYLPDFDIAIECQCKQHFGVGGFAKGLKYDILFNSDIKKYNLCKENNIEVYYLVDKKNISYIKNDIIYKDKIFTDLNDILIFIRKQKK